MAPKDKILRLIASMIVGQVFFSLSLFAQHADIRGVVSDSTTGERIPYANIIAGVHKGAAANESGFYASYRVSLFSSVRTAVPYAWVFPFR